MTHVSRASRPFTDNPDPRRFLSTSYARSANPSSRNKLKVFFDSQVFSIHKYGGISNYFVNLMKALDALGHGYNFQLRKTVNYHLYLSEPGTYFQGDISDTSRKALMFRNAVSDFVHLLNYKYDVIHSTHYLVPHLFYLRHFRNHVVTVHDMIPELMPQFFTHNPHYWKQEFVNSAAAIICPSQQTKHDLMRLYGMGAGSIFVVPHGVDPSTLQFESPLKTFDNFILFVGKREGYKNFTALLEAVAELARRGRSVNLFCAGGGPYTPAEMVKLRGLDLIPHVQQQDVSQAELAWLYRHAQLFVFPSLGEGFGLPVLEAMTKNCGVVLSDLGCFREILDDHGVFVNPKNPLSIAEGIDRALTDNIDKNAYAAICARFSWQETAARTAEVYSLVRG